jgi:hypothetical protein
MQMEFSSTFSGVDQCQPSGGSSTPFSPFLRILRTIPPERVGLHGEYDHSGLAKRVSLALSQQFQPTEVAQLRISQRGTVVVVQGNIANSHLAQIISVILSVRGAADVEINGISMIRPLCVSTIEPETSYGFTAEAIGQSSFAW